MRIIAWIVLALPQACSLALAVTDSEPATPMEPGYPGFIARRQ
jgi:hypothetical protein